MLDLDKLQDMVKTAVERISEDKYEPDKIQIHIEEIVGECIRQHARELRRLESQNKEAMPNISPKHYETEWAP